MDSPVVSDLISQDKPSRWSFLHRPLDLWLAIILILAGFIFGAAVGGWGPSLQNKTIIKGADDSTAAAGIVRAAENTDATISASSSSSSLAALPSYLKKNVDFQLYWDTMAIIHDKYFHLLLCTF